MIDRKISVKICKAPIIILEKGESILKELEESEKNKAVEIKNKPQKGNKEERIVSDTNEEEEKNLLTDDLELKVLVSTSEGNFYKYFINIVNDRI